MRTKDFRSLPSSAQEDTRRKAVNAVLGGLGRCAAAKLFGVTRQAIHKWMGLYQSGGETALLAKPRGAPKQGGLLKPGQCAMAVKNITNKCPEQLKLPGFWLWTREAVRDYLRSSFGVKLSLSSVGRYLRRWGVTPQKPSRRPYQGEAVGLKRWIAKKYPAIRAEAKKEKARVMWGALGAFPSSRQAGSSYGRPGQTPVTSYPGPCFSCQMLSAIDNNGHFSFKMFDGLVTEALFIDFLRRLIRQAGHPVFLILDDLPAHQGESVRRWVEKHSSAIRLFFLPKKEPDREPGWCLQHMLK
ncbi:MAG: IS630 family transposase [Planctomycetota bacterium]|jgi:transposase|nr:IS630 family transposase [Planctomycetota bacterium]